jgi:hypothetical protein
MRILAALLTLAALATPAAADKRDDEIPAHTTLTPGFGGGWFHANGRYGSGMLLQAKLERATGGRFEWQADYAIADWSATAADGGGALFHRLGAGISYAVGHAQMDRGTALWDFNLGVGAGLQMIHFDDRVSLVRADVAFVIGLRQIFEMNHGRSSKKKAWYGLSADLRLLVSPTPDGLDAGAIATFGMTLGR